MGAHTAAAIAFASCLIGAPAPYEPLALRSGAPRAVVDDRPMKDQASPAALAEVARALSAKGIAVVMLRAYAEHELSAADRGALKQCGDNTGCVAPLLGKVPHMLVTLRVTTRGDAQVVALSRTSTLRPQDEENEGGVVADAGAATALVRELLDTLFPQLPEPAAPREDAQPEVAPSLRPPPAPPVRGGS